MSTPVFFAPPPQIPPTFFSRRISNTENMSLPHWILTRPNTFTIEYYVFIYISYPRRISSLVYIFWNMTTRINDNWISVFVPSSCNYCIKVINKHHQTQMKKYIKINFKISRTEIYFSSTLTSDIFYKVHSTISHSKVLRSKSAYDPYLIHMAHYSESGTNSFLFLKPAFHFLPFVSMLKWNKHVHSHISQLSKNI